MQVIRDLEVGKDKATRSSFHPCEEPDNVSHLANPNHLDNHTEYTPFLPCHYFDYIGGTSTGALIAILLSRFRMTVEDCLKEYETMAGVIFGYARVFHKMNTFMGRNKYNKKNLEMAIREVIERRVRIEDDTEPLFQTEIDTCRGVVLATQLHPLTKAITRFLFRSYTPFSQKRHSNAQRTLDSEHSPLKNPGEGIRISILKVALARTAAPFYFGHYHTVLSTAQAQAVARIPTRNGTNFSFFRIATNEAREKKYLPEGRCHYRFEDAGFSPENNPCWELRREIECHHGDNTKQILVSIGTARPRGDSIGGSTLENIRRGLHQLGNPEHVHNILERERERGGFYYYRLNDEGGFEIEMDEWKPKKLGTDTIAKMRTAFREWLRKDGVADKFRECANSLVQMRRERMTTPRWERFALGQYFVCQVQNCPKDRDNQWLDREDFENHLKREHVKEDYGELGTALETCRRVWKYRQRAAPA